MTTILELESELTQALESFGADYARYGSLEREGKTLYGAHVSVHLPTGYGRPAPKTVTALRSIIEGYFGKVERVILPTGITHFGSTAGPAKYIVQFILKEAEGG